MDGIHSRRRLSPRPLALSLSAVTLFLSSDAALAQEQPEAGPQPLRVVWWEAEPLCFKRGNVLTGFGWEVVQAVLAEADLRYELIEVEGLRAGLEKLRSGDADVTAAAIPQLSELEVDYDYSYGIYETGIQIVASTAIEGPRSLTTLLRASRLLELLGVALLVVIVVAHAIWLIERGRPDSSFRRGYRHGIFDAFWWACVTATTVGYGDAVPRGGWGRAVALFWMFGALFLVSLFIGSLTAAMTAAHLDQGIRRIEDLRGHDVGLVAGTPLVERVRQRGLEPILFETSHELFDAMTAGKLDALIGEWAMASYYVRHEGKGHAVLAGPRVTRNRAALLLPEESPHREALDQAILRVLDSGLYEQIHTRWFQEITEATEK